MASSPASTPASSPRSARVPLGGTDLVSAALLGTDRRPLGGVDPTRTLLELAVRRRVEQLLAMGLQGCPLPAVAPAADVVPAPLPARALLAQLLLGPDTTALNLWLGEALDHRCGPAPEHWTLLLDRARQTAHLDRVHLGTTLGVRGRWFAAQNPAWRSVCAGWDSPGHLPTTPAPIGAGPDADHLLSVPQPWPERICRAAIDLAAAGRLTPRQAEAFGTAAGARLRLADYGRMAEAVRQADRPGPGKNEVERAQRGPRSWWPSRTATPSPAADSSSVRAGLGALEELLWLRLELARAFDPTSPLPARVSFTAVQGDSR